MKHLCDIKIGNTVIFLHRGTPRINKGIEYMLNEERNNIGVITNIHIDYEPSRYGDSDNEYYTFVIKNLNGNTYTCSEKWWFVEELNDYLKTIDKEIGKLDKRVIDLSDLKNELEKYI